jgi:integrase/recombinase XerC
LAALAVSAPDIFDVVGRWADWLQVTGTSLPTIAEYGNYVLRAGRLLRKDPRWFSPDDVVAVLKSYSSHGPAKSQMALALRSFYRFAEGRELCGNPMGDMKIRPGTEKEAAALTVEQLRALFRAAFRRDPRRGWTLILLYATGARIGSLVAATADDVTPTSITFRTMKGHRPPHEVPLDRLGRLAVLNLLAMEPGPRPTLVGVGKGTIWAWVRQAAKDAHVEVDGRLAWPHLLRHSAGTIGYEATKDPLAVAEFLGHKDLRQIRRYVGRADERKRRVAQAVGL